MSVALLGFAPTLQENVVARNQPFVPVLLLLIWGCGTVTAYNDPTAEEQASPALASQKHTVFNSAAPPESVNFFVEATSISSAYTSKSLGGLYEGYFDDPFGKCFRSFLTDRIAFGGRSSGSYEFGLGQRPAKSLRSRTPFRLQKIGLH